MLHPRVLADLLDDEVAVAVERLGNRAAGLTHDGRHVRCPLRPAGDSRQWLSLDGMRYDGEPFRVAVCGPDGTPLPAEAWPAGLVHSVHPVIGKPFACIRGTWEYYLHPTHHQERWDVHRSRLRLADLLDHLLRKAGQ
ncbi:MAG TPA: hypothetical protein VMV92_22220 [Streptosporangiaceae bacterium]|nr:hypothetical protein [Streptosporangiaceae bacterium]